MSTIAKIGTGITLCVFLILFIILGIFVKLSNILFVVIIIILLSLFYIILLSMHKKISLPLPRVLFIGLLTAGILIRLFYFSIEADILSDDVYRYFWDGKVQTIGINPYVYPPGSSEYDSAIKDEFHQKINHKEYVTIYPPLSQIFFFLVYVIGGNSFITLKVFYLLFDIVCGLIIYSLSKSKYHLIFYTLCPLIIVEVYIGMHIDILCVTFFLLSFYFFKKRSYLLSFLFIGCSILIKYITFGIFIIYVFTIIREQKQSVGKKQGSHSSLLYTLFPALCLFTGVIILSYVPYLFSAGLQVFHQLIFYNYYWEFNGILHPLLRFIAGDTSFIIKITLYSFILGVLALYKSMTLENKIRLALISLFLLNGSLFPWYLIILIPFLVSELHYADMFLFFIIQLSYIVLIQYKKEGIWEDRIIIRVIEYLPYYMIFLFELIKGRYVQKN